jgi:hypothetical protein
MSLNNKYYKYKTKYNNLKNIIQTGGNIIMIQHLFNYLKKNYKLSKEQIDNIDYEIYKLYQSGQKVSVVDFIIHISPLVNIDKQFLISIARSIEVEAHSPSETITEDLNKNIFLNSAQVTNNTFIPDGRFGLLNGIITFMPKK